MTNAFPFPLSVMVIVMIDSLMAGRLVVSRMVGCSQLGQTGLVVHLQEESEDHYSPKFSTVGDRAASVGHIDNLAPECYFLES
jgi:hypothetical protein